jgi:hypothetical protein
VIGVPIVNGVAAYELVMANTAKIVAVAEAVAATAATYRVVSSRLRGLGLFKEALAKKKAAALARREETEEALAVVLTALLEAEDATSTVALALVFDPAPVVSQLVTALAVAPSAPPVLAA